jgi:alkylation response protein AidB-like acyl-CoA dehydrogenase
VTDERESRHDCLDRAHGLTALVAALADEAEASRQLPEPLLTALVEAGLFRLLLPRAVDGAEIDPVTRVGPGREVGAHDHRRLRARHHPASRRRRRSAAASSRSTWRPAPTVSATPRIVNGPGTSSQTR